MKRSLGTWIGAVVLLGAVACSAHSGSSSAANQSPAAATSEDNMKKGTPPGSNVAVPPGTGHAGTPPPNIAPRSVKVRFHVEPAAAARTAKITMYGRPVNDPHDFVVGMPSVVHVTAEGFKDFEGTYSPTENTTITITLKPL